MQNWKGQPYLFQETLIITEKKKKSLIFIQAYTDGHKIKLLWEMLNWGR